MEELEKPAYACPLGGREMRNFVAKCFQRLVPNPQPGSQFFELWPAFYSLRLLSIFLRRSETDPISPIGSNLRDGVLEHWPDVWKWLKCASVTCRNPSRHSAFLAYNDHNDHCALFTSIAIFIRDCYLQDHPLRQKVKSTAMDIVVDLWYYQVRKPYRPLDPCGATLQVLGQWSVECEDINDGIAFVIDRIGRPVEEVAAAVLQFGKYYISRVGRNDDDPRSTISHLQFMIHLSHSSNIRNVFMTLHSVHVVTRALVHLSYKMLSHTESNSGPFRGVRDILSLYLIRTFLDTEGITWIRRSVEAGLLLAIARGGACDNGDNGEKLGLLLTVVYPYFIYPSILRPAARTLDKINVIRLEKQMDQKGVFWRSWDNFKRVFENRLMLLASGVVTTRCGNEECGRMGGNTSFKRCGGCQDVSYCSIRCQRFDWSVNIHRQHCKAVQRCHQEGKAVEPYPGDLEFVRYLARRDFDNREDTRDSTINQHFRMLNYTNGFPRLESCLADPDDRNGTVLKAELPWGCIHQVIEVER